MEGFCHCRLRAKPANHISDNIHNTTGLQQPTARAAANINTGKKDFEAYHNAWRQYHGNTPAPKPLSGGFVFVDENKDRAEERVMKWMSTQYKTVIKANDSDPNTREEL